MESSMPAYPEEEYRPVPLRLPTALTVVAWLFAFEGLSAAIDVLYALTHAKTSLQLGVLSIFIARGLLKLRRGWRKFALFMLWFQMIILPLFALCMVVGTGNVDFEWTHIRLPSSMAGAVVVLGLFALSLWEYRVLIRPDVRRLFYLGERERAVLGRPPRMLDAVVLTALVGFIIGLAYWKSSAESSFFTRLMRPSASRSPDAELDSFRDLGSALSWCFVNDRKIWPHACGEIAYAGETLRTMSVHGPHKLNQQQYEALAAKFKSVLSSRVDKIVGWHLGPFPHQAGPWGLGLVDKWYSGGANVPAVSGGDTRLKASSVTITYLRDHARGTAVLHVSMEPNYATLTVVEDVER
jgi:hypothetical protein